MVSWSLYTGRRLNNTRLPSVYRPKQISSLKDSADIVSGRKIRNITKIFHETATPIRHVIDQSDSSVGSNDRKKHRNNKLRLVRV